MARKSFQTPLVDPSVYKNRCLLAEQWDWLHRSRCKKVPMFGSIYMMIVRRGGERKFRYAMLDRYIKFTKPTLFTIEQAMSYCLQVNNHFQQRFGGRINFSLPDLFGRTVGLNSRYELHEELAFVWRGKTKTVSYQRAEMMMQIHAVEQKLAKLPA